MLLDTMNLLDHLKFLFTKHINNLKTLKVHPRKLTSGRTFKLLAKHTIPNLCKAGSIKK